MLDLQPCEAKKDLFESIDLVVGDVNREFRPIEEIPEWVMGLVTKDYGDTTAAMSANNREG
jgi:hypothetical protein